MKCTNSFVSNKKLYWPTRCVLCVYYRVHHLWKIPNPWYRSLSRTWTSARNVWTKMLVLSEHSDPHHL